MRIMFVIKFKKINLNNVYTNKIKVNLIKYI